MVPPDQTPPSCADQQAYFDCYSALLGAEAGLPPTRLADHGGRLADRPAWVFIAGYQAALRQCFPQLRGRSGWASYLVSEARDESGSATCLLRDDASGLRLHGTKNWIAASTHLSWLVVNATRESGSRADLLVSVSEAGVSVVPKPSGRFLPELAVGRAEFTEVVIEPSAVLTGEHTHAGLFGLIEARCLLIALTAHFAQLAPLDTPPAEALLLAEGLVTEELSSGASIRVLLDALSMLETWFDHWHDNGLADESPEIKTIRQRWSEDRRLLGMHRGLLEKKLAEQND